MKAYCRDCGKVRDYCFEADQIKNIACDLCHSVAITFCEAVENGTPTRIVVEYRKRNKVA